MTASLMTPPRARFVDNNGLPLAGGSVYTYIAGTTTPQASYTNQGAGTPNANPVVLDSAGSADIWLNGSYKIVVKDASGNTISTTDNITAFTTGATGATFLDGAFTLQNSSDNTKQVVLNLAGITTGTTVTMTVPNANFTIPAPSLPQTWTAQQVEAVSNITYGSTITPDFSLGNNFQLQLTGNPTVANPTNVKAGQSGNLYIYQDATGSRSITWGWGFVNPGSSLPSLQSTGGSIDVLKYTIAVYNSGVVTVSIATPGVVSFTNHGFELGQQVQLTTTGALPTGLVASTTYYAVPINANSFSLSTSLANAAANTLIATTGTQSGIHTLTGLTIALTSPKITTSGGYRALSSTDTVVATDNGKTLTIAGTCALALTAAATVGNFSCFIQNTATSGIQIITTTPNGTDNIDGANSAMIILPGEVREFNCNATAWTTEVIVPFFIHAVATASPTLPRNGYSGFSGNLWGSGASGGNGATDGGGGGGGGAYSTFTCMTNTRYNVNSMSLTLTVGAAVTGQSSANTAGTAGNTSSVEDTTNTRYLAFAYGGGAGGGGSLGAGGGGGAWGNNSTGVPNANGTPNSAGTGAAAVTTTAGAGGGGSGGAAGGSVGAGGGGGGGGNSSTILGGAAYFGGNGPDNGLVSGGGGGGGCSKATTGGAGGQASWGGGGGGGASNATGGAGGASTNGGPGGAGSSGSANGTAGTAPGGGGGGSVGNTSGGGAVGEVNIWGII